MCVGGGGGGQVVQENIFLISSRKYMLWVLIKTPRSS